MKLKLCFLALFSCCLGGIALGQTQAWMVDELDRRYETTASLAQSLWDYAEVGYQETRSTQLLQKTLEAEGFQVTSGVADIPTAFVATWGQGEPVIGILAEFDALPGINQDAVPYRQPIEGKLAGQACGHHLFGAASTTAGLAIKEWLKQSKTPGTVRVYGTPAEEGGSGKVYMARAGLFDDVDFVLHWHPGDENVVAGASTLANRSAKFRFRGVSAHAAAAPEKARSALDGVEAFNYLVNLLREHLPQETRIHYVITRGGEAPNVVPDFAEVYYYVRHPSAAKLRDIWTRVEQAARGAALGAGVDVDWEIMHGNHPVLINKTLALMVDEKMQGLGGISYSDEEQEFAQTLFSTLNQPELPLGSQASVSPYVEEFSYGSTDVGDVSMKAPTVGFSTATWVPGTAAHSWQAVAAGGMSIGHKGAALASKIMAVSAVELYTNPNLREAATQEFDAQLGDGFEYTPLLGDRAPPLDYRK